MNLRVLSFCVVSFCVMCSACKKEDAFLFTKLSSQQTGIRFVNHIEENRNQNILNYEYLYNGGGVAAGDFNNDDKIDLYFTANQTPNKLYLNKGNWQFEDITDVAQVAGKPGWKTGVTLVDINNDGWLDIYVCYSGPGSDESRTNQLFINQGTGIPSFKDEAAAYGLAANGTYSTQASFFDFDRDGDLDMFLLNHAKITYSPFYNTKTLRNKRHPRYGNQLFRNDNGVFKDVSADAGIHGSGINFGLGVSVSDLNQDGWPDIYVTNDYEEQDFLYLNNKNGTFSECLKESMRHIARFGMGSEIADFNNDLLPDVFVADMLPEDNYRQKLLKGGDEFDKYMLLRDSGYHHQNMRNMLQLNTGYLKQNTPQFSEIGQLAGVASTDWSWCPLFFDIDNDGWKDLFITNGYLRDYTNLDFLKYTFEEYKKNALRSGKPVDTLDLIKQMPSSKLNNYCYQNSHDLTFKDVSSLLGTSTPSVSNGATYADLDNDGDQDLVVNNINDEAFLYRNNSEKQKTNHYVKIKLKGTAYNRNSIGARVVMVTPDSNMQVVENFPTRGFQSCVPNELIFGTGKVTSISKLIVQWPDGKYSRYQNVQVDSTYTIVYDDRVFDSVVTKNQRPLFTATSEVLPDFKHNEKPFIDFKVQYLLPYQLSSNGPCLAKADVNGDGDDDFYIGGGAGQSGKLFVSSNNSFKEVSTATWVLDSAFEDTDALFTDVDNDKDLDLYVVSGSAEFSHEDSKLLQDRIYVNDGRGNFARAKDALPPEKSNGSCVTAYDYDHDGDEDIFVGGKSLPGYYPLPAYSYLLENNSSKGQIEYIDKTPDFLRKLGMLNTALWFDYNADGWKDLVVAGDFTALLVYTNNKGKLTRVAESYLTTNSEGLWSKLWAHDLDQDGDEDLIAGNVGLNTTFKASTQSPLMLYYNDFDDSGSIDPLVVYNFKDQIGLLASRDELLEQLPYLKRKFVKYESYAKATLTDILTTEQVKASHQLKAVMLQSVYLINEGGGKFKLHHLPAEAQFSKINGLVIDDFNRDQKPDILLAGNFYPYRVQIGRNDASTGLLLLGSTSGFKPMQSRESGFYTNGDVRALIQVTQSNGELILAGLNNDSLKCFRVNKNLQ